MSSIKIIIFHYWLTAISWCINLSYREERRVKGMIQNILLCYIYVKLCLYIITDPWVSRETESNEDEMTLSFVH